MSAVPQAGFAPSGHDPWEMPETYDPLIDIQGIAFFAMTASVLFAMQLGSRGALIFSALTIGYLFYNPGTLARITRRHWFFLAFPALAILSKYWSDAPSESFKHGLEYFLTVLGGLILTSRRNQRSTMFAVFLAFAAYSVGSLLWGGRIAIGNVADAALSGLSASKNEECSIVTSGALISLLCFAAGIQRSSRRQCLVAGAIFLVQAYLAVLTKSAGFTVSFVIGVMVFLLLAALGRVRRSTRALWVGLGAVASVTVLAISLVLMNFVLNLLTTLLEKDSTLTGRTYIWSRARDLIAERPALGHGFAAFWQQGNLDAEGLWQFGHIPERSGFNFHNTGYEVLVSLGWLGLILFALTVIVGLLRLTASYVRKPALCTCFWIAFSLHVVTSMPFETMGTYEFNYETVLLFAGFASFRPKRESAFGRAPRFVSRQRKEEQYVGI